MGVSLETPEIRRLVVSLRWLGSPMVCYVNDPEDEKEVCESLSETNEEVVLYLLRGNNLCIPDFWDVLCGTTNEKKKCRIYRHFPRAGKDEEAMDPLPSSGGPLSTRDGPSVQEYQTNRMKKPGNMHIHLQR